MAQNFRVARAFLLISFFISSACGFKPHADPAKQKQVLSALERDALQKQGEGSVLILGSNGKLSESRVRTQDLAEFEESVLAKDSGATIALNGDVSVSAGPTSENPASATAFVPDENLLFRGKQELGLTEWERLYPNADGRGVTVGIVDDGVAMHRPGLIRNRAGVPVFAGSYNASPLWQLPIRAQTCAGSREVRTATRSAALRIEGLDPAQITRRVPFDFTACGINPDLPLARKGTCAKWNAALPATASTAEDAAPALTALYVEIGASQGRVLVDLNQDGIISADEIFTPISERGDAYRVLPGGSALAFDVHTVESLPQELGLYPTASSDHPVSSCASTSVIQKIVTVAVPHSGDQFGGHGEGVAGIAAGHRIGNRDIDGVAPGARIFDVHFADEVGGRHYTIAEITRSLLAAGKRSDIVNLSYSLFFSSAASQIAMSRLITSALSVTEAVYFFSAGNNGPGRGSMNRALIYPRDALVVGAYLHPLLAQTTFGSALPNLTGVVSYSSRGPSADGGFGPTVLGPLAGIVPSLAGSGFGPFSGTSSATPALSGFTARLISQLKAEGLPIRREWIRRVIQSSARPLEGVPAIDQGWGLPWLPIALEHYRALANASSADRPLELGWTSVAPSATSVSQRGIYVRGERDRQDVYRFRIDPSFPASASEGPVRGDYAETVQLESTAPWVRVPPAVLISIAAAPVEIALDWDHLESQPGEHLAEVRVRSIQGGPVRAVLPVTVIVPERAPFSGRRTIQVKAGERTRWYIEKPSAHPQWFAIARSAMNPMQNLCGRMMVYDPSSVTGAEQISGLLTASRSEFAVAAPTRGIYEVIFEGGNNHTACPRNQEWEVEWRWHQLDLTATERSVQGSDARITLLAESESDFNRGTLLISHPASVREIELLPETSAASRAAWSYVSTPLDLGPVDSRYFEVRLAGIKAPYSFPYWSLETSIAGTMSWPTVTGLAVRGLGFSELNIADLAVQPEDRVQFRALSFERGSDGATAPARLGLELRTIDNGWRTARPFEVPLETRRGNLSRATLTIPQDQLTELRSWRCRFKPSGFELALPCADLWLGGGAAQ